MIKLVRFKACVNLFKALNKFIWKFYVMKNISKQISMILFIVTVKPIVVWRENISISINLNKILVRYTL